ncbi:Protein vip1 [Psilocybe cubensis]|uniref:Protein vip1 n=1 Tax=Psilocybe cubensis TaxID=181762 RepID=A0ACB8GYE9_PSICU|nr:Protein vip1 [Psilocybe cubensis]KAH9480553.1 Protein vip1 [Psilocybe cubensis]
MSPSSVNVSGIAPTTTKAQLNDFFTISSIDYEEKGNTAIISFEKPNAAKTALMLNGGALDGATLTVTSDVAHHDEDHTSSGPHVEQSDKPRAGIAAEYLARGYKLSDHILQRAIEIDEKQGISSNFLNYFHSLDKSVGERALGPDQTVTAKLQATVDSAAQQARAVDEQRGISKAAHDYYQRAITSPFGQKVKAFYTQTSKQVLDIHEEARRIADQEKAQAASAAGSDSKAHSTPVVN